MAKQQEFKGVGGWGGKRKGAGRPNKSGKLSHGKRPKVNSKTPLHITLRLKDGVVNLRTKTVMKEFRRSAIKAKALGFYVNHYSLLSNHIHLTAETENNRSLELGMRSFAGTLAKSLRRFTGGRGKVFLDRYHMHVLKTPREMRNALENVLLNHAKHLKVIAYLDIFSSAHYFKNWKELLRKRMEPYLRDQLERNPDLPLPHELSSPSSWMARVGWMKASA
jgi:hypothetical protein